MFNIIANKTILFIDGQHLFRIKKSLDLEIDYKKMLTYLKAKYPITTAKYFNIIAPTAEYSGVKPISDWLSYNGYQTIIKEGKEITDPKNGNKYVNGSSTSDLICNIVYSACFRYMDHAILIGGEAGYASALNVLNQQGIPSTVISSLVTQPITIHDSVRRSADEFIEFADIVSYFKRDVQGSAKG